MSGTEPCEESLLFFLSTEIDPDANKTITVFLRIYLFKPIIFPNLAIKNIIANIVKFCQKYNTILKYGTSKNQTEIDVLILSSNKFLQNLS